MVQPIDMQSLIGNIMSTDRVQHIVDRQAAQEQQRTAFKEHAQRAQQETQVRETAESDSERIEEDRERQSQRRRQRKHKRNTEEAQDEFETAAGITITDESGAIEDSAETRTVYNAREKTENLDGTEGHNLDLRI